MLANGLAALEVLESGDTIVVAAKMFGVPPWLRRCRRLTSFLANFLLQMSHEKGFSPVLCSDYNGQ